MRLESTPIALGTDVGNTPQLEAPALAELSRQIYERPLWMMQDSVPLEVDEGTWKAGRAEMADIQKARGFPLATAKMDRPNFLLRGIAVVIKDQA